MTKAKKPTAEQIQKGLEILVMAQQGLQACASAPMVNSTACIQLADMLRKARFQFEGEPGIEKPKKKLFRKKDEEPVEAPVVEDPAEEPKRQTIEAKEG